MSLIQRYPHCWNGGLVPYKGVLISGNWNRGVPLYPEVSLFQGAGIYVYRAVPTSGGWNRCVQRCPYFRGLE